MFYASTAKNEAMDHWENQALYKNKDFYDKKLRFWHQTYNLESHVTATDMKLVVSLR